MLHRSHLIAAQSIYIKTIKVPGQTAIHTDFAFQFQRLALNISARSAHTHTGDERKKLARGATENWKRAIINGARAATSHKSRRETAFPPLFFRSRALFSLFLRACIRASRKKKSPCLIAAALSFPRASSFRPFSLSRKLVGAAVLAAKMKPINKLGRPIIPPRSRAAAPRVFHSAHPEKIMDK